MVAVQVIVGGLLLGAIYALFSSGLTLIWGMMNFINFAHGEFVMLGMYAALMVVVWIGGGPAIFAIAAAVALAALGVAIYFSLIRHVTRGPMLAQILSTFGLALLLRYTAFWIFSANFVSLPQNALSGTVNLAGIYLPIAQLVAGVVAITLTIALHLLLTRTTVGSKLLAVAEDRTAAMLMGITARPHAGAGLGPVGRRRRHRRRLDGDLLSVVAVGRRNIWADRFRRGGARRFRQRARLALCRADHRPDPGGFRVLAWRHL